MSYIAHYPEITPNGSLSIVLEVFANFTAAVEGHEKVALPIDNLFDIIRSLEHIFDGFVMNDNDLGLALRILENITKLHYFHAIVELLIESKIFPQLLEILNETELD